MITFVEDECHGLGGVFYSIDVRSSGKSGDEEMVAIDTAVPYCFGTCSEDQLVYLLLETKELVTNVKLSKEPNDEPPNKILHLAGAFLASVLPIASLVFHL